MVHEYVFKSTASSNSQGTKILLAVHSRVSRMASFFCIFAELVLCIVLHISKVLNGKRCVNGAIGVVFLLWATDGSGNEVLIQKFQGGIG